MRLSALVDEYYEFQQISIRFSYTRLAPAGCPLVCHDCPPSNRVRGLAWSCQQLVGAGGYGGCVNHSGDERSGYQ